MIKVKKQNHICIGSGLVALDVVITNNQTVPERLFAGGSCGNVLTILSFLKWTSIPIARLKINNATNRLVDDLTRWGVNTSFITQTNDGSTPIIIHRIKKDKNGNSIHTFYFKNLENGDWLPSYKPVLKSQVEGIIKESPIPNVFYFDRINRSSIELAKYYKAKGSVIFFEPSSIGSRNSFEECLMISDILKFSNERIKNYSLQYPFQRVPLEIETFGKEGLRYRYSQQLDASEWIKSPSYQVSHVVDAAGSGDWFSAGIISKLGLNGVIGFKKISDEFINEALKYGQALGALNCLFYGARGLMYSFNREQVNELVKKLQSGKIEFTLENQKEDISTFENNSIRSLYDE